MATTFTEITEAQAAAFRNLLKQARGDRTQHSVAEGAGLSQSQVSAFERGPTPGMQAIPLLQLLDYYGIEPNTVAEVLGWYAPKPARSEAQTLYTQHPPVRLLREDTPAAGSEE